MTQSKTQQKTKLESHTCTINVAKTLAKMLQAAQYNKTSVSNIVGVSRRTLNRFLDKLSDPEYNYRASSPTVTAVLNTLKVERNELRKLSIGEVQVAYERKKRKLEKKARREAATARSR